MNKESIQEKFGRALSLHRRGECSSAKEIYESILQHNPTHFDSTHLLGLVHAQSNNLGEAKKLFIEAIRLNSTFAPAYFNLGKVQKSLNEQKEAIDSYKIAIQLNPKYAEPYIGIGKILFEIENLDEALTYFDQSIRLSPNHVDAVFNRGVILQKLQKFDAALLDYDKIIYLDPSHPYAHINRAIILKNQGHLEEALASYDTASSITPINAEIYYNRGLLLHQIGRIREALLNFDEALALSSDKEKYFYSRAKILYEMEEFPEALRGYQNALRINPYHLESRLNIGAVYQRLNKYDAAIEEYKKAIELNPGYVEAFYNLSLAMLSVGDFSSGWDHYEWRLKEESFQKSSIAHSSNLLPEFTVRNLQSDLIGKTLYIAAEQGIGDHIMFLSILPDLSKDARKIICQIDSPLIGIFSRCFPSVTFVPTGDMSALFDVSVDRHIRLGSLGFIYRRNIIDFPGTPYLTPDSLGVANWMARLPLDRSKKMIGISWRGGTDKTDRKERSMTLEQLTPLLERQDCTFVSLQYGEVEDEIKEFNSTTTNKIIYFPRQDFNDFDDFAGLIGALDCVVSVQNTTVHTCGALGKPCLALLPFRPQWRYGASGASMPWYNSVKLFRQKNSGQWDNVLQEVNSEVSRFLKSKEQHQ